MTCVIQGCWERQSFIDLETFRATVHNYWELPILTSHSNCWQGYSTCASFHSNGRMMIILYCFSKQWNVTEGMLCIMPAPLLMKHNLRIIWKYGLFGVYACILKHCEICLEMKSSEHVAYVSSILAWQEVRIAIAVVINFLFKHRKTQSSKSPLD